MRLINTDRGVVLEHENQYHALADSWDALVNHNDLVSYLRVVLSQERGVSQQSARVLATVGTQEVWAAGVTYTRSREARIDESKASGGATFYDKVYEAERPEIFFKAVAWRVRAHGEKVRIRKDSKWNVPEPELALVINRQGVVVGYTIGNDMSSRDIEGENPLYLPQAKMYDGSCALGPAMLVAEWELPADTEISIAVARGGQIVFNGVTVVAQIKRTFEELVGYLYREMSFPNGAVLLTGTGVVPPDNFTLASGDEITIGIASIGILENVVE